jgi:hypothetical protein
MSDTTEIELVVVRNLVYDFTNVINKEELEYSSDIVPITFPHTVNFVNLDQSVVQESMIQEVLRKMKVDETNYEEKLKKHNEKLSELRALAAPKNDFDDDRPF